LNCIHVDDDIMSVSAMKQLIQSVGYLNLVKSCTSPVEALEILKTQPIDLVFLDVEMPEMNGLELIKKLDTRPLIILTTSHPQYAVEAFEYNVVDYLMKPVETQRFVKATAKAKEFFDHAQDKVDTFSLDFIFIRKNSVLNKVPTKDILWIEALGDYVTINTEDKKYTLHITLKALEKKLPAERFVRVHRSFIVQLEHINTIDDSVISIQGKAIPVGALYRENFMKRLNLLL
jgi:two-component system LytT family response regulator